MNINLRKKVIDLTEILGSLSPDYLVHSKTKLDDSFSSAQFNLPNYEIRARRDRDKNGGGLIEYVKKDLICKRLKIFETRKSEFTLKLLYLRRYGCALVFIGHPLTII